MIEPPTDFRLCVLRIVVSQTRTRIERYVLSPLRKEGENTWFEDVARRRQRADFGWFLSHGESISISHNYTISFNVLLI